MDPNPDYDASDEVEYGANWFAWILRGVVLHRLPTRRSNHRTEHSPAYQVGPVKIPVEADALLTQHFQFMICGQRLYRRIFQRRRLSLQHLVRCRFSYVTIVSGLDRCWRE